MTTRRSSRRIEERTKDKDKDQLSVSQPDLLTPPVRQRKTRQRQKKLTTTISTTISQENQSLSAPVTADDCISDEKEEKKVSNSKPSNEITPPQTQSVSLFVPESPNSAFYHNSQIKKQTNLIQQIKNISTSTHILLQTPAPNKNNSIQSPTNSIETVITKQIPPQLCPVTTTLVPPIPCLVSLVKRVELKPRNFDEEEFLLSPLDFSFLFDVEPSQPTTFASISPVKSNRSVRADVIDVEDEEIIAEEVIASEDELAQEIEIESVAEEDGQSALRSNVQPPVSLSNNEPINPLPPFLETASIPSSTDSSSNSLLHSLQPITFSPPKSSGDEDQHSMDEVWKTLNLLGERNSTKLQFSESITTFATSISPIKHLSTPPHLQPHPYSPLLPPSPPPSSSQFSIRLSQPTPQTPLSPQEQHFPVSSTSSFQEINFMDENDLSTLTQLHSQAVSIGCASPGPHSAESSQSISSDMPTQLTNTFAAIQYSQASPTQAQTKTPVSALHSNPSSRGHPFSTPLTSIPEFLPPLSPSNTKNNEQRVTRALRGEFEKVRDTTTKVYDENRSSLQILQVPSHLTKSQLSLSPPLSDNPFTDELPAHVNQIALHATVGIITNKSATPPRFAISGEEAERKYDIEDQKNYSEPRKVETPKSATSALRAFYMDEHELPILILPSLPSPISNAPLPVGPIAQVAMSQGDDDEEDELMVALAEEAEAKARRQKLEERNAARRNKSSTIQQQNQLPKFTSPLLFVHNTAGANINCYNTPSGKLQQKSTHSSYEDYLSPSLNSDTDYVANSSTSNFPSQIPPVADMCSFGFQTAKGNAVKISNAALKRSAELFEEVNAEFEKEKELSLRKQVVLPSSKDLTSLTSILEAKNRPSSKPTPTSFNKPRPMTTPTSVLSVTSVLSSSAISHSSFNFPAVMNFDESDESGIFKTANGKNVQFSSSALQRAAALFQSFDEEADKIKSGKQNEENPADFKATVSSSATSTFSTPRPYSKPRANISEDQFDKELINDSTQSCYSRDRLPNELEDRFDSSSYAAEFPLACEFNGFQTAKGNKVSISAASMKRAAALFADEEEVRQQQDGESSSNNKKSRITNSSAVLSSKDQVQSSFSPEIPIESNLFRSGVSNDKVTPDLREGFTSGKGTKIINSTAAKKRANAIYTDVQVITNEKEETRGGKKKRLHEVYEQELNDRSSNSVLTPHTIRTPLATLQSVNSKSVVNSNPKSVQLKNALTTTIKTPAGQKSRAFISPRPISAQRKNQILIKDGKEIALLKKKQDIVSEIPPLTQDSPLPSLPPPSFSFCPKDHQTPRHFSLSELKAFGLSPQVISMTSVAASSYVFDFPPKSYGHKDAYQHLIQLGCQAKLLSESWVKNAWRWIVWKLASYECIYPAQLSNRCLTYSHVLRQLKKRYEKECVNLKYPAIRGMLEGDDGCEPNRYIVLVIADIFTPKRAITSPTPTTTSNLSADCSVDESNRSCGGASHIELTDGWYSISAKLDTHLYSLLTMNQLFVGQKLRIMQSRLLSTASADSPPPSTTPLENTTTYLALTINGVRHAPMHQKLGFVRNIAGFVVNLQSVVSDGGIIPALNVCVYRVYPLLYMEKKKTKKITQVVTGSSNSKEEDPISEEDLYDEEKIHRNQKAEDAAQDEWIKIMEKKMEDKIAAAEKNREDRNSVEEIESSSQEGNTTQDNHQIDQMKDDEIQVRNVVPYLKALLREIVPPEAVTTWKAKKRREIEDDNGDDEGERIDDDDEKSNQLNNSSDNVVFSGKECYYTMWRPCESDEELFVEGKVLTLFGSVPSGTFGGILRLSSRKSHAIPNQLTPHITSIYREPVSLPHLHQLNRWAEFDAVLICVVQKDWGELYDGKKRRRVLFCVSNESSDILSIEFIETCQTKHLPATLPTPNILIMTGLKNQSYDPNLSMHTAIATNESFIKIKALSPTLPQQQITVVPTVVSDKKPRRSLLLPKPITTTTTTNTTGNSRSPHPLHPTTHLDHQYQTLDHWYHTDPSAHQLIHLQMERATSIIEGQYNESWIGRIEKLLKGESEDIKVEELRRITGSLTSTMTNSSLSIPPLECGSDEILNI